MNERRTHHRIDRELRRIERDWRLSEIDQELDRQRAMEPAEPAAHWTVRVFVWFFILGSAWLSFYVCTSIVKAVWRLVK